MLDLVTTTTTIRIYFFNIHVKTQIAWSGLSKSNATLSTIPPLKLPPNGVLHDLQVDLVSTTLSR